MCVSMCESSVSKKPEKGEMKNYICCNLQVLEGSEDSTEWKCLLIIAFISIILL
jgi:hypothetical protein